jgi:NADH dehydrogenase FAD-containing subunit
MCRRAEDIEHINKNLPDARSVTVVGGGYTGVEIISTLAQRFPEKQLCLIHGAERILERYSDYVSTTAYQWLEKRGVEIIMNEKASDIVEKTITTQTGKIFESDMTIFTAGISINDESFRNDLCFVNQYHSLESDHIYLCGDASSHGLSTTAHNAMIEGRRVGHLVADKVLGETHIYKPLENRIILALAFGTRDGMITNGPKGFVVPYVL